MREEEPRGAEPRGPAEERGPRAPRAPASRAGRGRARLWGAGRADFSGREGRVGGLSVGGHQIRDTGRQQRVRGVRGRGRAEPEAPTFHIPGKGEAKKEQRRGRRGSWRPRPRWERIPRDTNVSTEPLWRAGSRPRRPGAAESRSCGRTEKQGRSCTCRSGERRADRRSSSISYFGGKGPSERGESPEHRPCSGGWGETQCFSGGAPLARRQAAAHPGNNRRQNTCAQKTRPRRMRRVWATRWASPAFAPSVPDTRKGRQCVRACFTGEQLGADGVSRASPLHPGKQDSIRWLDESRPLSKLPAAAAARAARWAGVTGGRLPQRLPSLT